MFQKTQVAQITAGAQGMESRIGRGIHPRLLPPGEAELAGTGCPPLVTLGGLLRGQASLSSFAPGKPAGTPVLIAAAQPVTTPEVTRRQLSLGRGKEGGRPTGPC